jgi:hypothetical protein
MEFPKLAALVAEREKVAAEGAFGTSWAEHLLTCSDCQTDAVRAMFADLAPAPATGPSCPIRGHDHKLTHRRELTQDGTGQKADIWACATDPADPSVDRYRWFLLRGRELSNLTRMNKPRFGWNSEGIDR